MKESSFLFTFFVLTVTFSVNAQLKDVKGQLIATDEVEGLHILNKTASKYTISKANGSFVIPAKVSDTLVVSGLKYDAKTYIITQNHIDEGQFTIQLTEKINALNEVIVGKILTGSLQSDLENSDAKTEVDFYDLGIPGNTKLPLTQNERKLYDADGGPIGSIQGGPYGGGVGLNLHKILNKISGRTKKLKAVVALDNEEQCIARLRSYYEASLFKTVTLDEKLRNEYFYFCQDDASFNALCDQNNDLATLEFLKQKLKAYKNIRASATKD